MHSTATIRKSLYLLTLTIVGLTADAIPPRDIADRSGANLELRANGVAKAAHPDTTPNRTTLKVDAEPYSAKCDGNTDDTAAFALAVKDAATSGATILLPAGVCIGAISIPDEKPLTIEGRGVGLSTLKLPTGANKPVVATDNFAEKTGRGQRVGSFRLTLRNLTIDGNKSTQLTPAPCVQHYGHAPIWQNVIATNCSGDGFYTEWAANGSSFDSDARDLEGWFDNLKATFSDGNGIVNRGPSDSYWRGIVVYRNAGTGYRAEYMENIYAANAHIVHLNSYLNKNGGCYFNSGVDAIGYICDAGGTTDYGCAIGPNGSLVGHGSCDGYPALDNRGFLAGSFNTSTSGPVVISLKGRVSIELTANSMGAGCLLSFDEGAAQGSLIRGSAYIRQGDLVCGKHKDRPSLISVINLVNVDKSVFQIPWQDTITMNGVRFRFRAKRDANVAVIDDDWQQGKFFATNFIAKVNEVVGAGSVVLDLRLGDMQTIVLNDHVTKTDIPIYAELNGGRFVIRVCQNAVGGRDMRRPAQLAPTQDWMIISSAPDTCTSQAFMQMGGWIYPVSPSVGGGVTTTKVIGSCTFHIRGGLIISITGC